MSQAQQSLAEQVRQLKHKMAETGPAEILSVFADERAQLAAAGIPDGAPTPGTPLPHADLLDIHGDHTTLTALLAGKPAVLVFYRGAWCPWCNLALRAYQEQIVPTLTERGIQLIALSPQKPDGSLTMTKNNDLTFTVASDPGNQLARRLGILNPPRGEAVKAASRAYGAAVAEGNIDGTDDVPMPTTLAIDHGGVIRWVDIHPDYSMRTEPSDILNAVTTHLPSRRGHAWDDSGVVDWS